MANIKNFGLSGISADVQFGKAGGRVVYDAGNSVFKVTQADGSTLDNIRVATTPVDANDAASKAYVDSKATTLSNTLQAEVDATQAGAGLGTDGTYTANGTANYISAATSLKDADNKLDAALKVEEAARIAADGILQDNIDTEEAARIAADNALDARLDIVEGGVEVEGSIAKAEADAKAYTDARETAITTAYQSYADQAEVDAKAYTDARETAITTAYQAYADQAEADAKAYADTLANAQNQLSELVDVDVTSRANGDLLMYNTTTSKWENVDVSTSMIDEGTNLYWTEARGDANFASNLAASDTSDLAEGTNLYFTTARARDSISVVDNGGDGSLSYDAESGVITFTGPSAAEVRAHFTGGTGISITNGDIALDFTEFSTTNVVEGTNLYYTDARVDAYVSGGSLSALDVAGNAVIDGNLSVVGNVSIGGSITVAQSANVTADFTGNMMTLSGDLTVQGSTNLTELVTITSATTKAEGSNTTNVFEVVDTLGAGLLEVKENGDVTIGGILTVNGTGTSTFAGDVSINGSITVDGNATFTAAIAGESMTMAGDLIVQGNTTIGNADTDQIVFVADVASNFVPDADATYNLGAADKAWNNLYTANVIADTVTVGTLNLTSGITGLTLDGLDDVEIANVTANQIIAWDGAKWVNIDNVNVNGSLTVAGDINAEANIILNSDVTGAAVDDAIIRVERGTDADVEIKWNETTNQWEITNDGTNYTALSITGGTGVAVSSTGVVSIGQAVGTTDDVTFNDVTVSGTLYSNDITAADVTISGNLIVAGTTTTVNTETIALADNTIVLNSNATGAASQDAGIEVERGDDTNVSLLWDETNDRWTVGGEDFVAANFIGDLTGDVTGNLTGNVTGQVSDISNHTTDALAEGTTNLYYTNARVAAYLTANAYATEAYTDAAVADKNSFVVRATMGTSGSVGTIVNVAGHTYYVSRITVKVTDAYDAEVSVSDGTNTLMTAAEIEEDVVGTYVAELPFATATAAGATISLVSAATAGAALVTVEYVQL